MTVYLVGAGPGDPGLLTRRGAELLSRADVVVYDRLVDPALLLLARLGALLVDVGKEPGGASGSSTAPGGGSPTGSTRQDEINRLLVGHGLAGREVVRLKGGDPFLFGRGGEEAEALREAGIRWEVVPGVTSAVAVPAYAGVPVTHRGLSTSVTVVTGHVGDPTAPEGVDWESLARAGGTIVVLMGMATRAEIARRLIAGGRPASTPVVVVEWGTTPGQRTERTTLDRLEGAALGSPAVIVVGPVAALDLSWSSDRPLGGRSVVVTRAAGQAGELCGALTAAGARVVELPVLEIADPVDDGAALREALAGLDRYAWVAFTSANAVHRVAALVPDARAFAGVGLAVVGAATAAALAGYHLVADLLPERASSRALAEAFPPPPGRPARVLFPRAAEARETLPTALRARGWEVEDVVAYRTVEAPPPPDAVLGALRRADAVTFASPSAVRAYLGLRTKGGLRLSVPPVVACIGPVTAAAAREAGLEVAVEAAAPSAAAMVDALAAHLLGRPSP